MRAAVTALERAQAQIRIATSEIAQVSQLQTVPKRLDALQGRARDLIRELTGKLEIGNCDLLPIEAQHFMRRAPAPPPAVSNFHETGRSA